MKDKVRRCAKISEKHGGNYLKQFQTFSKCKRKPKCWGHQHEDPTPSRADIQMTQAIVDIAKPLGISVHDHIIVGKDGHASLKGLKLI